MKPAISILALSLGGCAHIATPPMPPTELKRLFSASTLSLNEPAEPVAPPTFGFTWFQPSGTVTWVSAVDLNTGVKTVVAGPFAGVSNSYWTNGPGQVFTVGSWWE